MNKLRVPAMVATALLLGGCGDKPSPKTPPAPTTAATPAAPVTTAAPTAEAPPPEEAVSAASAPLEVKLLARSGSKLTGSVTLSAVQGGVKVAVAVQNVPPGKHGCHIHDNADCSAADGSSAGGHFNPGGHDHGLPDGKRHLGDLGNIEVGADGSGKIEVVIQGANLEPGDPHSFLGRGIIVHDKEDDGGQPTGNAGGRIGCGEIVAPPAG